jgi:ABC-type phosphate/phosphonate transport system substrate-binding protein
MTPPARASLLVAFLAALALPAAATAADLRIVLTQSQAGEARKYQPLLDYLGKRGVQASFVTASDYRAAADLFAAGQADAMFGGSGVSAALLIKELASPLVRAVADGAPSTYHAVVIAPKGSPRFAGARSFDGKRVIFAALASAGEFYFHSVGTSKPAAVLKAASHGAAVDALSRGQADVAVVKNHVWTSERAKFPGLELVGEDNGENPDGSFVVSRKLEPARARALAALLVGLKGDGSPEAAAAKSALKIQGYIPCTVKDFEHTLGLLKRAGVGKDFAFSF